MPSRWTLLGNEPTSLKEIALVPCDGCRVEQRTVKIVQDVTCQLRPHLTCNLSLPSILNSRRLPSLFRLKRADAVIALSGCIRNCPQKLLSSVREPDISMQIERDLSDGHQSLSVAAEVDKQIGLADGSVDKLLCAPLAAQTDQRQFVGPKEKVQRATQPPVTPYSGQPAPAHSPTHASYFDAPAPRSWLPVLMALLVVAGGVVWYGKGKWFFRSDEVTPHSPIEARPGGGEEVAVDGSILEGKENQNPPLNKAPDAAETGNRPTGTTKPSTMPAVDPYNRGWIGSRCVRARHCKNQKPICLAQAQRGYCTTRCRKQCPDRLEPGYTTSHCVDNRLLRQHFPSIPDKRGGHCMTSCSFSFYPDSGCRSGASCIELPLRRDPSRKAKVCVPKPVALGR